MEFSKTLEEVSKFFNEILGYLLPGFIFNLLVNLTVDSKYVPLLTDQNLLNPWVVIFLSYIMGYLVYGITISRDNLLKKVYSIKIIKMLKKTVVNFIQLIKKDTKYKDSKILLDDTISIVSGSEEYKLTKKYLAEHIGNETENWNFNNTRSLAMSYIPEADQKIYTFMFRSELANHIGFIFFAFGSWMLLSEIVLTIFNNTILLKSNLLGHSYIPILLVIISYFFHITRKRFLIIAYKIPFSIFISKYKPIK